MYFDIPVCEKKERMNLFKSMRSLILSFIIAMTAFPAFAAEDLRAANLDTLNKFSIAISDGPPSSITINQVNAISDKGASAAQVKTMYARLLDSPAAVGVNTDSIAFVKLIIQRLFDRAATYDEIMYWADQINSQRITRSDLVLTVINSARPADAATLSAKVVSLAADKVTGKTTVNGVAPVDTTTTLTAYSGATKTDAATQSTVPSRNELNDVLALLKELTVDLKIEEEDKSTSYQNAEKRINEQSTKISAQLGGDIGSPSKLDSKVEELQKRLANAKTDDELKEIAAAILPLQAQTAIWVSNTGIMVTPQSGGAEYSVQMNDAIKAINDRVIAGVQNTIRSKPVTCITAYNPSTHMVETRCN